MGELVLQYVQRHRHKWRHYLLIVGELSFNLLCMFKGLYILDVTNMLENVLYNDIPINFYVMYECVMDKEQVFIA
jgi:hypothetical protein